MATTTAPGARPQTNPTWAQRLARRRHLASPIPQHDEQAAAQATAGTLWALFDAACQEANAALEAMGDPGRIGATPAQTERVYQAAGPDGSLRTITVVALLPVIHGRLCGGAYVGTSRSRLAIYLVPGEERGLVRWEVATTGQPFTSAIVQDLFLSVFGDDPAATLRLSPLSGQDLFEDMWAWSVASAPRPSISPGRQETHG